MLKRISYLIIVLSFFGLSFASAQNVKSHTLSSGKQIKVLAEGKITFKAGPPALMLKYETDISFDDLTSLTKEAEEIWKDFKDEVEKNGFTSAILSANQPSQGKMVSLGKMYNFVFVKNETGEWYLVGKK